MPSDSHEGSRTAYSLAGVQGTPPSQRGEGYAAIRALVRDTTLLMHGGPEADVCGVG